MQVPGIFQSFRFPKQNRLWDALLPGFLLHVWQLQGGWINCKASVPNGPSIAGWAGNFRSPQKTCRSILDTFWKILKGKVSPLLRFDLATLSFFHRLFECLESGIDRFAMHLLPSKWRWRPCGCLYLCQPCNHKLQGQDLCRGYFDVFLVGAWATPFCTVGIIPNRWKHGKTTCSKSPGRFCIFVAESKVESDHTRLGSKKSESYNAWWKYTLAFMLCRIIWGPMWKLFQCIIGLHFKETSNIRYRFSWILPMKIRESWLHLQPRSVPGKPPACSLVHREPNGRCPRCSNHWSSPGSRFSHPKHLLGMNRTTNLPPWLVSLMMLMMLTILMMFMILMIFMCQWLGARPTCATSDKRSTITCTDNDPGCDVGVVNGFWWWSFHVDVFLIMMLAVDTCCWCWWWWCCCCCCWWW